MKQKAPAVQVAAKTLHPGRMYFFTTGRDACYNKRTISKYFRRFWDANNTAYAVAYCFRHNYATTNINSWTDNGMEFSGRLACLSRSMGHAMLESTKYYYDITTEQERKALATLEDEEDKDVLSKWKETNGTLAAFCGIMSIKFKNIERDVT